MRPYKTLKAYWVSSEEYGLIPTLLIFYFFPLQFHNMGELCTLKYNKSTLVIGGGEWEWEDD